MFSANGVAIVLNMTLPYPPSVNHYWRVVGGRPIVSSEGRKYRAKLVDLLRGLCDAPLSARLCVQIEVFAPDRRRRDLDNVCKALLDALKAAGVYQDDSQIDALLLSRGEVVPSGRVEVLIIPLADQTWLTKLVSWLKRGLAGLSAAAADAGFAIGVTPNANPI